LRFWTGKGWAQGCNVHVIWGIGLELNLLPPNILLFLLSHIFYLPNMWFHNVCCLWKHLLWRPNFDIVGHHEVDMCKSLFPSHYRQSTRHSIQNLESWLSCFMLANSLNQSFKSCNKNVYSLGYLTSYCFSLLYYICIFWKKWQKASYLLKLGIQKYLIFWPELIVQCFEIKLLEAMFARWIHGATRWWSNINKFIFLCK
jgi:hypothetical protein